MNKPLVISLLFLVTVCLNTSCKKDPVIVEPVTLTGILWETVTNEAVLSYGASGQWDAGAVWNPSVIKDGDTLRMWYTGFNKSVWELPIQSIGYAWSLDGINWNKSNRNPVLYPDQSWEGENLFQCAVIKDGNTFKIWYGAFANSGKPTTRIGYAISYDCKTWIKNPGPILLTGRTGDWDDNIIVPSSVIKKDNEYKMWYWAGRSGFPFESSLPQIGLATSPDGINWTKYNDPSTGSTPFSESDPVVKVGSASKWDSHRVVDPMVILTGSGYEMWYVGLTAPIAETTLQQVGYATSVDGIIWKKSPNNPVIHDGLSSWGYCIYGGTVLNYDGHYNLWYANFHTPPTQAKPKIGYAQADTTKVKLLWKKN